MQRNRVSRRTVLKMTLATAAAVTPNAIIAAQPAELALPANAPTQQVDVETQGIDRWTIVSGQWAVEDMPGVPVGKKALVQRATKNEFNVIVAPAGPFTDVDVSVRFYPLSGKQDASGGIVFRFTDGKYYVVRANALEDNFRLYYCDRRRHQLASVSVKPPALGQWHLLRVVMVGDRIQASLNGVVVLDHRDRRFASGRVGLWTKADAVTAFNDLTIRGVRAG